MNNKDVTDSNLKTRKNVFALGFVSFFTDLSSEMIFSLLPTFILGLSGSSTAILGLIEGVAEALSYGMRAISGFFSDKFRKRKLLVIVGYGLSNIVKPLFSVAQSAFDALIIRVTDRIGKGVRTSPRDALLSESVSEKHRGAAFGLHRTLDQTGAILGPLIASAGMVLLNFSMRDIFWLSFIPGMIAIFILIFMVQERISEAPRTFKLLEGIKTVLSGRFPLFLLLVTLFSLGAFNFSFILLNAKEANLSDAFIPLIYAIINLSHTLIAIPSGILSDRIGKEKVLIIAYGTFLTVALLLLFQSGEYYFAFLIAIIFGIYDGITNTVTRALIPKYASSSLRGTTYGIYYLIVGLSFFISNTIIGILWNYYGSSIAAIYSITLSSIAIIGMLLFLTKKRDQYMIN